MKYVMLEVEIGDGLVKKVPIIFPDFMIHEDLYSAVAKILYDHHDMKHIKPVSAGDVNIRVDSCHGQSITLKVKSDKEDVTTINMYNYCHGM